MTDHQAIMSLEREFPGWMVWREGYGRWLNSCFARCHVTDAGVSGEDWADLRDQIVRAEPRAGGSWSTEDLRPAVALAGEGAAVQ